MVRFRDLNSKKAMTPDEIAEQYGLSKGTLANLRNKREGARYFKCGRKVLYRVDDFERWLYRNPVQTIDSHREG